jgi:hypothetical protein
MTWIMIDYLVSLLVSTLECVFKFVGSTAEIVAPEIITVAVVVESNASTKHICVCWFSCLGMIATFTFKFHYPHSLRTSFAFSVEFTEDRGTLLSEDINVLSDTGGAQWWEIERNWVMMSTARKVDRSLNTWSLPKKSRVQSVLTAFNSLKKICEEMSFWSFRLPFVELPRVHQEIDLFLRDLSANFDTQLIQSFTPDPSFFFSLFTCVPNPTFGLFCRVLRIRCRVSIVNVWNFCFGEWNLSRLTRHDCHQRIRNLRLVNAVDILRCYRNKADPRNFVNEKAVFGRACTSLLLNGSLVRSIPPVSGATEFYPKTMDATGRRFRLSAHDCQVPTPTSHNLDLEQQIRIFEPD